MAAMELYLIAPRHLGLETRAEVLHSGIQLLEDLPAGGRLVIDLAPTLTVDSSGLGVLMLLQRRAAERRQTIALRHPSEQIRYLLLVTKLADLFELGVNSH
jgi:anti-anti-sigma regulatory factor